MPPLLQFSDNDGRAGLVLVWGVRAKPDPTSAAQEDYAPLARRIATGTEDGRAAEVEFVRLFARRVRLYGLRHLRDAQASDDLTQHVLMLVIERLRAGAVREPSRLDSFVLGVCRMTVRDLRRAESRRRAFSTALASEIEQAAWPQEPVEIGRLGECLDRLGHRERTVVTLTFYGERTADEIASDLTMSPGNVRVVRHRALEHLRRCLGVERQGA